MFNDLKLLQFPCATVVNTMPIHDYLRTTNWNRKRTRNGYSELLGNTISSFTNLLHVCWEKELDKLINLSFLLFKCFPAQNLPVLWSSVRLQCWLWHNPQPSEHLNSFICLFKTRGKRSEEALSWCLNWDLKGDKQPCASFKFQNLRVKYLIFSINLFLCVFETRKTL